jgi:hypothetical protein
VTKSSIENSTHPTGVNLPDTKYPIHICKAYMKSKTTIRYKYKVQPPIRVLYQNENFTSYTDTKYLRVFIPKEIFYLYIFTK